VKKIGAWDFSAKYSLIFWETNREEPNKIIKNIKNYLKKIMPRNPEKRNPEERKLFKNINVGLMWEIIESSGLINDPYNCELYESVLASAKAKKIFDTFGVPGISEFMSRLNSIHNHCNNPEKHPPINL
jgi:hypothetical protein